MEKRRKRNRKRRMLVLLIALFFTTIMFTTATYAWFTANQTVRVNTLTVNVAAKNGIQISVDGTNWKSIVQTADITGASTTYSAAVNQLPETMEPVSTIGKVDTTGKMEMFYGQIGSNETGDYILTATKDTETYGTTGKFIAFDLFFQVNAETPVYLSTASGVKVSEGDDTGIKNASRVAFVELGNADSGAAVSTIQALGTSMSAEEAAAVDPIIWEPNFDVHSAAGVGHARDTYGVTTQETGAAQVPYAGVKAEIAASNNVKVNVTDPLSYTTNHGNYFDTVTVDKKTAAGAGFNSNLSLLTLQAGITKVRIYMWVEGQDVDCENNASGGDISYDLVITTLES